MSSFLQTLAQVKTQLESVHFGLGKERDFFVENLSLLTSSGMGVSQALDEIIREMRSREMKRILEIIKDDVESGAPLWRSLERTGIFPDHTVSLLRVGEESGKLIENLKVVASQEEKQRTFRSQLQAAMLYPLIVFSFTVVIGVGVAWFILPRLATVFTSLKVKLPLITRVLLAVGEMLGGSGAVLVPLFFLVVAIGVYLVFFFPQTRFLGRNLACLLPGTSRLIQELEVARFSYLLGTLFQAGIPVTQALDSLEHATGFPYYARVYRQLRLGLDQGYSFQKTFAEHPASRKWIPGPVQQLIVAGEQSGNLTEILLRISQTYEEKTATTTKNLTVILEPILLIMVWFGVLGVALAVILPIYGLIGNFNQGF